MSAEVFEIRIQSEVKVPGVSLAFLKRTIKGILRSLGWKKASLGVLLVGDAKMRRMNREFLNHDRTTDVISFGFMEPKILRKALKTPAVFPGGRPFLGDLLISVPTTRRQAAEYGNSFRYELCFYLCHGILHLMGDDDKTRRQAQAMERKQKKILKRLGI